jgi:hypothetical protein
LLRELKREVGWAARAAARKARSLLRSRATVERRFRPYFADEPVDLDAIRDFKLENFPPSGPLPWLDELDAEAKIRAKQTSGDITGAQARACRNWASDGFIVLERFFEGAALDRIWEAYEAAVRSGALKLQPEQPAPGDHLPSRSLDSHLVVPEIHALLHDEGLRQWAGLLFGREAVPFQTLVSHKGSEQREHSDAIHMTTYPVGYLAAAWIAFEDIRPDCGPIAYYPGSQRLPYLSSLSLGIPAGEFRRRGYAAYSEKYEPAIQRLISERNLRREFFLPKKGDVLLWHANLIHAGSPRRDLSLSRKAVVLHYFARGAVCYHDLSGTLTPRDRLT